MEGDDSSIGSRRIRFGPGFVITAAFIGPGTVVTASRSGAALGCELLWTIVFACVGAIVLQSLAARLGIVREMGLGEAIRERLEQSVLLRPAIGLIVAAIGIGNAAYQTGNLTGAAAGMRSTIGGSSAMWIVLLVSVTGVIVCLGKYRTLQRVLVLLVLAMSLCFLFAAAGRLPSLDELLAGLVPRVRSENLTLVLALIGTTIVPYNLFLHASAAQSNWRGADRSTSQVQSDIDTTLSVALGGVVTASILISANAAFYATQTPWSGVDGIADQLQPSLGRFGGVAYAIGLFAAGLTSSITAPLATAFALCGCLGWSTEPSSNRFRSIALSVVVVGGGFAMVFGKSPGATIVFAQVANGLLLPIAATFLLLLAGTDSKNWRWWVASLVVIAVGLLGVWRIVSAIL